MPLTPLSAIADHFDGVLIDQFGVLHDGRHPFPGAIEALGHLRDRGAPVVALTNSGKRAAPNLARLAELGFDLSLFRALISSGELVRAELEARLADGRLRPGAKVTILARDDDRSLIEDLALEASEDAAAADLLLIGGAHPETTSRERYAERLRPAAERGAPALCANPDLVMYAAHGPDFAAGAVARDYAAMGGPVTYFGKPAAPIFEAGIAALGLPPERVLMIGDSLAHDIAGASACGCRTLFLTGGVQASIEAGDVVADWTSERLLA